MVASLRGSVFRSRGMSTVGRRYLPEYMIVICAMQSRAASKEPSKSDYEPKPRPQPLFHMTLHTCVCVCVCIQTFGA
jgi:hypothetical protein